jgi:hypothetical protein
MRERTEMEFQDPQVDGPEVLNAEERQKILSEMGKLRALSRRQYQVECYTCGKEIVGLSRKKFCGQTCQRVSWRRRLAAMKPGDDLPPPEPNH